MSGLSFIHPACTADSGYIESRGVESEADRYLLWCGDCLAIGYAHCALAGMASLDCASRQDSLQYKRSK